MKARVRTLHSPDVDLQTYEPSDPGDVGLLIQVLAGPADGPGEESFDIVVCTSRWVERHVRENGPLVGRHHVIVNEYDAEQVRGFLTRLFESEVADDWPQLAGKLARFGQWEFEDYRE
jgi:hypothetical protein